MPPRPAKKPKKDTKPPKVTGPVTLPTDDDAFIRESTLLGVFPIGKTSLWNGIADGRFPAPVKLTKRVNGWRVGDIRQLLASRTTHDDAA